METVSAAVPRSFVQRSVGAALLDAHVYEEVEADRGANAQAAALVALAAVAAGIGSAGNHGMGGILWYTFAALLAWYVWAGIAYLIGTRLLPGPHTQADHGELLRTIGFSSAPGLLRVLGLFSPIAGLVFFVSTLWMLIAMVVAVRQALDYTSTGRAIAVCAIGFPVYALVLLLFLVLLGPWPV